MGTWDYFTHHTQSSHGLSDAERGIRSETQMHNIPSLDSLHFSSAYFETILVSIHHPGNMKGTLVALVFMSPPALKLQKPAPEKLICTVIVDCLDCFRSQHGSLRVNLAILYHGMYEGSSNDTRRRQNRLNPRISALIIV